MKNVFNKIIENVKSKGTCQLVAFLIILPNIVLASNFSLGFGLLFIIYFWVVSVISYFLVKLFTRNISNNKLRNVLRILSVTIFISPSSIDGSPFIISPIVVFTSGSLNEIVIALISISIFTILIYFINKADIFDE